MCLLCLFFCDRHTAVWNFHTPMWILWKAAFESAVLRFAPFSRQTASKSLLLHWGHPSGTRRVVDRVVSSFSHYYRSFLPNLLELDFASGTGFVPLQFNELFGIIEVGTHPQSCPRVLIHPCSRKLHAKLDHALLLVNSSPFRLHNPNCLREHKNTWFSNKTW